MTDKIFPHPSSITALLISPFESDHVFMRKMFSHSSWTLYDASDVDQAIPQLREGSIPVVLCSADPQRDSWKAVLRETAEMTNPPRVIVFSRLADERLWGDVIHNGGYTVLDSPFDKQDAVTNISLAWHSWYLEYRREQTLQCV